MGTTTGLAIPYVDPTDLIADYPAAMQAQSEKIEELIGVRSHIAMRRTSDLTVPTGTDLTLPWESTLSTTGNISYASGTFTITVPGVYLLTMVGLWQAGSSGSRYQQIMINGSTNYVSNERQGYHTTFWVTLTSVKVMPLVANDTVAFVLTANSATQTLLGSVQNSTACSLTRIGL